MKERTWAIALWICANAVLPARCQDPWKIEFVSKYKLEYFDTAVNFDTARALCGKRGAVMVRTDNEQVRRRVYADILRADVGYFWIGAKRKDGVWKWLGEAAEADTSFITWLPGHKQLDGSDTENRMVVGQGGKYSDVVKNVDNVGTICQMAPYDRTVSLASIYELWFYYSPVTNFNAAKALCTGGNVTYMDDKEVETAVYDTIRRSTTEYFWIGATGTEHAWTWLNGTTADTSFITWYTNQPDNYKGNEHNLVVRARDSKYGDVKDDFYLAGTICQRQIVLRRGRRQLTINRYNTGGTKILVTHSAAITDCTSKNSRLVFLDWTTKDMLKPHLKTDEYHWVSAATSSTQYCASFAENGKREQGCNAMNPYVCEQVGTSSVTTNNLTLTEKNDKKLSCTANGVPQATVTWRKNNVEIPGSSSTGIYQTKSPGLASLHVENAKVTDERQYECMAFNLVGGHTYRSRGYAQLNVPSTPAILSIEPYSCNSSLKIRWKPHHRAVEARHAIGILMSTERSFEQREYVRPNGESVQIFVSKNLTSSTKYTVLISTSRYSISASNFTGGIPQPVENAIIRKVNGSCQVNWEWPVKTLQSVITGFKIVTSTSTAKAYSGTNAVNKSELNEAVVLSLTFTVPKQPNRNHFVTVESQTCAGSGTAVTAKGTCITDVAAPKSVDKLYAGTGNNVISDDGMINLKMKVPSESSGPISCVFVIVETGNSTGHSIFTENDLIAANGTSNGTRYIAIAVDMQSMIAKSELNITLGNGTRSNCNIRKQPKVRRKRDVNDVGSYVGQNNPLSKEKSYSIYVATTTPSDDEVFFKISEPLIVEAGDGSGTSGASQDSWIIPVIVSLGVVILIVIVVIIVICLKRRKSNEQSAPEKRSPGTENSHANGTETTADEPRVAIRSFPSAPVTVNIEQGQALYENRKDDTTFRMSDFEEYYNRLCQENCSLFKSQFKTIKDLALADMKSTSFAAKPELKKKNRYKNILPFDSTRVVISGSESGYINACYVDGFYRENKFIATQGPLAATENDFWLMVVENECRMIVMVAKCFEAGKKKCQKYWPDEGKSEKYGKITVQNATEIKSCGFIQRKFRVSYDNETIYVQQFQYLNWPDHGIPNTTSSLVRMHKAVMMSLKQEQTVTPVIVHCSAGAGRTGTFIGYDYLLEQSSSEDQADVLNCVLKMRSHRVDMIQNCDQYILLHKLVLEHYLFADTDLNPQDITQKLHDMERGSAQRELSKEFGDLSRLTPVKNISSKDNEDCNVVLIIPRPGEPSPPSLNASWVESYDENSPMMAAKTPDRTSSSLFWRAISDNRVNTIITINGEQEKERYWPAAVGENASFGDVRVSLLSENDNGGVVERVMQLSNGSKKSTVTQYHYSEWDVKNCPKDTRYILELVENMQKNTRKENGAASVITCSDGIGRSGTYCAIVNLIERLKTENKVDVFRAVKDLRDCRPGMVKTLDQYVFCHRVISDYLKSFDIYSNFG